MTDRDWPTTTRFRAMCAFAFAGAARARDTGLVSRARRWVAGRVAARRARPPSNRKLLLALAGCGRHVWPSLRDPGDEWNRAWVERAERFADGAPTAADLRALLGSAPGPVVAESARNFPYGLAVLDPAGLWDKMDALVRIGALDPVLIDAYFEAESAAGCDVIRDVVGDPFRPVAFDPGWRTGTAVALARGVYDARDFSPMPILADALQDAGCDDEDVLGHCRDPQATHVRGCWVVDLVLEKA